MKIQSYLISLLVAGLMSSCASSRNPITLHQAVIQTVDAMKDAYDRSKQYGGTWGLAPSQVTIVYNVSNEVDASQQLTLAAATVALTVNRRGSEAGFSPPTRFHA